MNEKKLLKIIEQAAIDGRTELDLSKKGIKSLPREIGNLTKLKALNLGRNKLNSLPPEIGDLKNLTWLHLSGNQLNSLPVEVGNLENLGYLYLGENELSSLPAEIGNLKNLKWLGVALNQLSWLPAEIGNLENLTGLELTVNDLSLLPSQIGNLKHLTHLDLSNNRFSSLLAEIGNLKNLTGLFLSGNQLTDISILMGLTKLRELDLRENQIHELPREIVDLGIDISWKTKWACDKYAILLEGNPLESPPIEIINQGREAVRNYFESIETEEISKVYEAKLLIVGEGGVGKTCLRKRLMKPDKTIDEKELTTKGIEIKQWMIETPKAKNFRVNFWDFGGQEIYHATHQFFLTKRSLYLFVWAARTDDDLTSFDYWLNVVKLLSDNSPVIVVLNKIDERIKSIDEQSLQGKFKNVMCLDRVSAMEGTGIEGLTENIRQQIDLLPHIGSKLPKVWIDIRMRLEGIDKNYISWNEYKAICKEFGLDEEMAEFLSRYYHDLGVFLHFLDNPVLREIVFLKPDWATNAVYKVVDTREIQESYGKFQFEQLKGIWIDYPEDKFAHLLELMKKFELCFEIPKTRTYIVPELLRPGKTEFEWEYADNLRFEYRYDFMPAGIITSFIVRTHDLCKEDTYWKNGVVLEREDTEAQVVSERLHRKISIWIRGKEKKELLAIIRREIDYIHKTLNYPDVKEMIPCICSQCARAEQPYFYDYKTLCRFRAKGKIACEKSTEDVLIERLLGDYERFEDKVKMEFSYREHSIGKIEISPHINVSPKVEQTTVIERPPKHEANKKRKWYKTPKAIVIGFIALLGGFFTLIRIYESDTFKNILQRLFEKPKTEQIQDDNKSIDDRNEISPP